MEVNTTKVQARDGHVRGGLSDDRGERQRHGSVRHGGSGGTLASVPVIVAQDKLYGQLRAGHDAAIYTADDGFYRVSVYMNVATLGDVRDGSVRGRGDDDPVERRGIDDGAGDSQLQPGDGVRLLGGDADVGEERAEDHRLWPELRHRHSPHGGSYNAYVLVEKLKK